MAMGVDVPAGLSKEEQLALMEKENELAKKRDEEQRAFLNEQEKMRTAREKGERLLIKQEEEARETAIRQQEQEAMEVATGITEEEDVDTSVANMFSSLSMGTDANIMEDDDSDQTRPE